MSCHRCLIAVGLVASLLAASGCQTLTPDWSKSWFGGEAPRLMTSKYGTPVKMAVIWSPAVLNQAGAKPVRGFGGRIYFYDRGNRPIPVEGQLVVFAYNDSKPHADGKTPDARYAFTPEQFTSHYSPTDLGAAYSVWIPWDEVGRPQVEISLVPVFTATSGQLVIGESSRNLLPGPTTPENRSVFERFMLPPPQIGQQETAGATPWQDYGVAQASFQQAPPGSARTAAPGIQTTSIRLPSNLTNQLAQAPPQKTLMEQWAEQQAQWREQGAPATAPFQATAPVTASPPSVVGAPPPQWTPPSRPPTRFEPPKLQVPNGPPSPPTVGQPRMPPFLGEPPFVPPSPPQFVPPVAGPAASPSGFGTTR
jgi:hypothetical protein